MINATIEKIKSYFKGKTVVIAFSGGVDSTVLLNLALQSAEKVLAVTVKSTLVPGDELAGAMNYLDKNKIQYKIISINLFDHPEVVENNPRRCYFCKRAIFQQIIENTAEFKPDFIVEGSNVSDLDDYRPGMEAIKELGIKSPFLDFQINKDEIRKLAAYLNLDVFKKPATTCLATRIPYGDKLEKEKILRIERAEYFIRDLLDIQILRVRDHGDVARIEINPQKFKLFFEDETREEITEYLKELGYKYVSLDLQGYNQGSMNIF